MLKLYNINNSEFLERYPQLKICEQDILRAIDLMMESFEKGNKMLVMGNGGSSADAEHICAELLKSNLLQRMLHHKEKKLFSEEAAIVPSMLQNGLPAISLGVAHSFMTAFLNDVHPEYIFAQQIWVHGKPNDVVFAISTSGKSKNIILGLKTAKAKGLKTLLLTGSTTNICSELADVSIHVPEIETHKVQELHLPVYHYLCLELERIFFDQEDGIHYKKYNNA